MLEKKKERRKNNSVCDHKINHTHNIIMYIYDLLLFLSPLLLIIVHTISFFFFCSVYMCQFNSFKDFIIKIIFSLIFNYQQHYSLLVVRLYITGPRLALERIRLLWTPEIFLLRVPEHINLALRAKRIQSTISTPLTK